MIWYDTTLTVGKTFDSLKRGIRMIKPLECEGHRFVCCVTHPLDWMDPYMAGGGLGGLCMASWGGVSHD